MNRFLSVATLALAWPAKPVSRLNAEIDRIVAAPAAIVGERRIVGD